MVDYTNFGGTPFKVPVKGGVVLDGVRDSNTRVIEAMRRALEENNPQLDRLKSEFKFGRIRDGEKEWRGVEITDAMDTFRHYASAHKLGAATDVSPNSVPEIPIVTKNRKGKTVTKFADNHAKEQFVADVATVLGVSNVYASFHNVGRGNHFHLQSGNADHIAQFSPRKSEVDSNPLKAAEQREAAASRLSQVFSRWGMDPQAAIARIQNESGDLRVYLTAMSDGIKGTMSRLKTSLGMQKDNVSMQGLAAYEKFGSLAGFGGPEGSKELTRVHDWVKGNKNGSEPSLFAFAAYQGMLQGNGLDIGEIDGKPGNLTLAGAKAYEAKLLKDNPGKKPEDMGTLAMASLPVVAAQAASKSQRLMTPSLLAGDVTFKNKDKPVKYADMPNKVGALPQQPIDLSKPTPPAKTLSPQEQLAQASIKPIDQKTAMAKLNGAAPVNVAAAKPAAAPAQTTAAVPERPASASVARAQTSTIVVSADPGHSTLAAPPAAKAAAVEPKDIAGVKKRTTMNGFEFGRVQQEMQGTLGDKESKMTPARREEARKFMKSIVGEDIKDEKKLADAFAERIKTFQEKAKLKTDGIMGHNTARIADTAVKQKTKHTRKMVDGGPLSTNPHA